MFQKQQQNVKVWIVENVITIIKKQRKNRALHYLKEKVIKLGKPTHIRLLGERMEIFNYDNLKGAFKHHEKLDSDFPDVLQQDFVRVSDVEDAIRKREKEINNAISQIRLRY